MQVALSLLSSAGGSFIVLGVMVAMFFAVVFGFFTIRGSGIDQHPNDGLDGAPGSSGPSEASGMGRNPGTTSAGHSVGDTFSTFGTR